MCFRTRSAFILFIFLAMAFTACAPASVAKESEPATPYETSLEVAYPEVPVELGITSELPGMIRLIGYSGENFVSGIVEVSNRNWLPETQTSRSKVVLLQKGDLKVTDFYDLTNLWRLRVSDNQEFALEIRNRQAEGHWNLSGLPINALYAEMGTAKNSFTFDEPNPTVMEKCEIRCGVGNVVAEGILNAACQDMIIESGQGGLTLRFGGKEILQALKVTITASTSSINITVLPHFPARITVSGKNQVVLGEGVIKPDDAGNVYETTSFRHTQGKNIDISISGGSGTLYFNQPST